ncbi:hypothetical protein [Burkholderia ubonensis]|uniref:hypothetical protein n=1 Tax=Burkholderia ubonensis TaxID=101571 RepID=UPI0012FBFF14|nr:hypothetical protein [Burkholderia ubonensis]
MPMSLRILVYLLEFPITGCPSGDFLMGIPPAPIKIVAPVNSKYYFAHRHRSVPMDSTDFLTSMGGEKCNTSWPTWFFEGMAIIPLVLLENLLRSSDGCDALGLKLLPAV